MCPPPSTPALAQRLADEDGPVAAALTLLRSGHRGPPSPKGLTLPKPTIVLGVKEWDHLMPLLTRDVELSSFRLQLTRTPLIPDLAHQPELHGGETSFSQLLLAQARGDQQFVALPAFIRSAFRHRSIIVAKDSDLTSLAQLRGRRVGLNGWADSGNIWTKSLAREAGVRLDEVDWLVAPVASTSAPDARPRMGETPPNVTHAPAGRDLTSMLAAGEIDAMMSPVMPAGFHEPSSPFRRLVPDYRRAEEQYLHDKGFMPGIHIIVLRRSVFEGYPQLAGELLDALHRSYQHWLARRVTMVDTTPWLVDEIEALARTLGLDWSPYAPAYTDVMTEAFASEITAQGIGETVGPQRLFADVRAAVTA